MNGNRGGELTARERAVLAALEADVRAEDPWLAELLSQRVELPSSRPAADHPAGAPYWYWWRRPGQST